MRLAWFTPWPPQTSGIAGRSRDVVSALAARGSGIDVFVDERLVPTRTAPPDTPAPGDIRVQSAHEFVWRATRGQYDLVVYEIGNSRLHHFTWPYLAHWPGLVVLHDARVHHARAAALLSKKNVAAYRSEFAWSHPDVSPALAELAVGGFDGSYYYQWPMTRAALSTARLVAVHSRGALPEVEAQDPEIPLEYIALGEGFAETPDDDARERARFRFGLAMDAVVFGVYGALTPAKRIPQILRTFARTRARLPGTHLLLAGTVPHDHDWRQAAAELGLESAVTFVDAPDDESFDEAIVAADVTLHLRWPTALETSGPWLRALSAARATVIIELEHQSHVPAYDPRTWTTWSHVPGETPMTVAIDILDEEHSLGLALRRLATDADLRRDLGDAARRYWEREHSVPRMVADYERVIDRARHLPAPSPSRRDTGNASTIHHDIRRFGNISCELF